LQVTGSLALFIYGMKVLSDGIQRASGGQLRSLLRRLTRSNFNGIAFGTLFTSLIQSSSASTVMIISLVNAGMISVRQSVGLIMGANIGTTITAWIVSFGGFLFKLSSLTLPILAVAVPLFFRSDKKYKAWGETAIGFALLFIGLDFLKASVPSFQNQEVFDFIKGFTSFGLLSNLLFIIIGLVITLIVQSSSASMTLTLAMTFNGWISVDLAAYMIIGENIGTCFTAEVAAVVGNKDSRHSARIHTLFNVLGALIMFLLTPAVLDLLEGIFDVITNRTNAFASKELSTIGLAAFHTSFNVLNTLILVFFIPFLIRMADWTLPRGNKNLSASPNKQAITLSELSPLEIQHQLLLQGQHIETMHNLIEKEFKSISKDEQKDLFDRIEQHYIQLFALKDRIEDKSFKYSNTGNSQQIVRNVGTYFRMSQNMCRIADLTLNLGQYIKEKSETKVWLTPLQRTELYKIMDSVQHAIQILIQNLEKDNYADVELAEASEVERVINQHRDKANEISIENKDEFDFNLKGTLLFIKMISICENIGDRLYDISNDMIANKSGSNI
jgi:phosphate:Na+ symporter